MHSELLQCSGGINSHLFAYAYSDVSAQLMETISHQIAVVPVLKIHQPYAHVSAFRLSALSFFGWWSNIRVGKYSPGPCPQPSALCSGCRSSSLLLFIEPGKL